MKNNESKQKINQELNVLKDLKPDGKEKPWRQKKVRSLIVADSFERLGERKRSTRIKYCGTYLEFTKVLETGKRHLSAANFCRERLCPMCQWRRSLRTFYELSNVMDEVELAYNDLIPLFFTVTVKNCDATIPAMTKTLDDIFEGWHRFWMNRKLKPLVLGWFRALEITYNKKTDEFHPHIHAIILVKKSYFKTDYMETAKWVELWRSAMRLDYDPVCDIRKIKNDKTKRKGIAEAAKYTVKDKEVVTSEKALTDRLIGVLSKSLKNRRLTAYGGVMKQIAAKFGQFEDLVNTGDGTIRQDVAIAVERYSWRFGLANYVRRD